MNERRAADYKVCWLVLKSLIFYYFVASQNSVNFHGHFLGFLIPKLSSMTNIALGIFWSSFTDVKIVIMVLCVKILQITIWVTVLKNWENRMKHHTRGVFCPFHAHCTQTLFSLMTSFVWTLEPWNDFEVAWQISSWMMSIVMVTHINNQKLSPWCFYLSGHFFLASPVAGMGTLQDPGHLGMVGTLDA